MRKIMSCLGVTVGAVLVAATFTGTAAAQENNGRCEDGEFCLWEHDDRRGGIHDFVGWDADHYNDYWYGTRTSIRKQASSGQNKVANCSVRLWSEANGTGRFTGFDRRGDANDYRSNLSDFRIGDNANVSHTYVYCP